LRVNRRYLIAVPLLAVLAVVFGLVGTVAPPLAEEVKPSGSSSSSSSSVAHFQNPPTYDSGWVDIRGKCGQYFSLKHNLNTTEVVVDLTGKQSLDPMGGALAWSKTYGGASFDWATSVVQTADGGIALAGFTNSFDAGSYDFWLVKTDASGTMEWSRTYGGAGIDEASSVVQTSDGGYALAGHTSSYGAGRYDFWLVKTDSAGNHQWNKTYGGTNDEEASSVVQTLDGGYALAGYTNSYGAGLYDLWLVKTNSTGAMQWNKTYGGTSYDTAHSLVQTVDSGYALAGETHSYGAGNYDSWLVKTNSTGGMQWNKTYGGTTEDLAHSLVQTGDGGYALAGSTYSFGAVLSDFWLVKTDSTGGMQWNKTYGGASYDRAYSLVQTCDGGYALTGYTFSFGAGGGDFWLVKTDSAGNALWNRTYGGASNDRALSLVQTADGGIALAGYTNSFGAGSYDFWLVKVKPEMNLEHQWHLGATDINVGWSRTFGGPGGDHASSVVQTGDGGYALAGYYYNYPPGEGDFWLVKTEASGTIQWSQKYGGTSDDSASSLVQTGDGGYALAGTTWSYGVAGDFWLVKTDAWGLKLWDKTYGGTSTEYGQSFVQTGDGGYAMAGITYSYGVGTPAYANAYLVKTDVSGNMLWNNWYGGGDSDEAFSMVQTVDGGYALAGCTYLGFDVGYHDFWLVKTDSAGNVLWSKTYGWQFSEEVAYSLIQTGDGGYALAGLTGPPQMKGPNDFWLVKTDSAGNALWNRTYGSPVIDEVASSLIQTSDGGYAIAGGSGDDAYLVKTDPSGNMQWSKLYGALQRVDSASSVVQTIDGGYALAGSYGNLDADGDFWLVKTNVEMGLAMTGLSQNSITLYRGKTDLYWNYVRVRMWLIKEPTWIYGDINMDGVVDVKDLYIVSRNYGKTFSLLSLSGIIAIAGIQTIKTRKKHK